VAVWAGAGSRWPCWGGSSVGGVVGFRVDGGVDRRRACRRECGCHEGRRHKRMCLYMRRIASSAPCFGPVFFSAFWLRSSVVSVLISLISGIRDIVS